MLAACQAHGQLTTNQIGYHLFDRRVEKAVLPYCRAQGIGFMAYGTLAFGLLSGAFSPETQFVDWDWRSRGDAFGLPLFQREPFLRELRAVERLKAVGGGIRQIRRADWRSPGCWAGPASRSRWSACATSANSRRMWRRPIGG